jgi:hypothetical protein
MEILSMDFFGKQGFRFRDFLVASGSSLPFCRGHVALNDNVKKVKEKDNVGGRGRGRISK